MKIVIYQTSDLHGYIYPTNYVNDQPLGFLKIASYILNDEKNYDASLKIDCGDLVQGSALTHFLSKQAIEENPIIKGLEAINYNAYVLGNHEFNYGLNYLKNAYDKISDKVINANIKDLEFLDVVKQYAKYEKELKENCDFIIVCYHGGFEKSLDENMTPTEALTKENQGSELLENFDSINMILSGHQHRSFITKIKDVICSQPMHNGQSFTKVVIDTESNDISYELIDVSKLNDDIDDKLENIFTQTKKDLEVYLDKIIGEFDKDIKVDDIFLARLKGHPFINFLHQVQLDVSGADFSALSVFDSAMGFSKKISVRDVLINYPYPNTLKVLEVTGEKLKEAIEKSATYFVIEDGKIGINKEFLHPKVQHYNYDTFGGLEYKIDLSRDFYDRVVYMKKDGKDISMDKTYTIVLNNYRASNTSIYPAYKGCKVVKEINLDMSEIILDYIQKHKKIVVDEKPNNFIN